MARYEWINIDSPDDFEQLQDRLDSDFDPERIAKKLKASITDRIKAVLLEHNYTDKDYSSAIYGINALKFRPYRTECVRLHFFDDRVDLRDCAQNEDHESTLCNHYHGYMVLRPMLRDTVGRSVLSPDIRVGAHGKVIQGKHSVNLLGHRLSVRGFPTMNPHVEVANSTHVAAWTVLRHYSESYSQYGRNLIRQIVQLSSGSGSAGISPVQGLQVYEAERAFRTAGCVPLTVARNEATVDEEFFGQLLAYLESGFPVCIRLAVNDQDHVAVAVGLNWREDADGSPPVACHAWSQVKTLLTVDDSGMPYTTVPVENPPRDVNESDFTTSDINAFVVALPDGVGFPAEAMSKYSKVVQSLLIESMGCDSELIQMPRYFLTTIADLRHYARNNEDQFGETLVDLLMRLDTVQFVWIVEFTNESLWQEGKVVARGIVDAFASPSDPNPLLLLHNEETVLVFDRTSVQTSAQALALQRPSGVPLQRMELNLLPVRS